MIRRFITSLVAAALLLTLSLPVRAMIGGAPDGGAHPNVGAIDIRLAGQPILASGVLISPTVFLTAGHVTRFFDLAGQTRARVTFDSQVTSSSTWYWGTVHTDPAFRVEESFADFHDLGVVVFDAPIRGIVPASLPEVDFLEHLAGRGEKVPTLECVGYGTSEHVGDANDHGLQSFTSDGVRKAVQAEFKSEHGGWIQSSPTDGNPCYGDSGGPLLMGNMALGVLSLVANLEFCKGDARHQRLDSADHRAFLGQYVSLP